MRHLPAPAAGDDPGCPNCGSRPGKSSCVCLQSPSSPGPLWGVDRSAHGLVCFLLCPRQRGCLVIRRSLRTHPRWHSTLHLGELLLPFLDDTNFRPVFDLLAAALWRHARIQLNLAGLFCLTCCSTALCELLPHLSTPTHSRGEAHEGGQGPQPGGEGLGH